jgi:hypothetical protein
MRANNCMEKYVIMMTIWSKLRAIRNKNSKESKINKPPKETNKLTTATYYTDCNTGITTTSHKSTNQKRTHS